MRPITEFLEVVRYKDTGRESPEDHHSTSAYQAGLSAATPGNLLQAVPSLWRSAMDTNIVVYSQCAVCEEPGLFIDPANCAHCLSGYEPIESDDKDDDVSESFPRVTA